MITTLASGSALISSELLQIRHCSLAAYKVGSGISFQPGANGVEVSAMNPVNATALYISASRLVLNYDPGDPKAFTEINRLLPYFRQSLSCCVCGETLFIPFSRLVFKNLLGSGNRRFDVLVDCIKLLLFVQWYVVSFETRQRTFARHFRKNPFKPHCTAA